MSRFRCRFSRFDFDFIGRQFTLLKQFFLENLTVYNTTFNIHKSRMDLGGQRTKTLF
jgi:hypothetical protein